MIEATRNWLRRNRTRFAVGFGLLGGTYLVVQYVLSKLAEARERMSSERIARENLRRRFQQNQEDCTITVLALLPTAAENILESLPVENITHELQQQRAEKLGRSIAPSEISPSEFSSGAKSTPENDVKLTADDEVKSQGEEGQDVQAPGSQALESQASEVRSQETQEAQEAQGDRESQSPATDSFIHTSQLAESTFAEPQPKPRKSKAQLWNELKIQSITRSFTMIYTVALLTLFTRIQLNLLGRRSYLSSVVSLATPAQESGISLENHDDDRGEGSYGNDFETNRKFLTFSWWLLHQGWKDLRAKVEAAVTETFSVVNVREDLSLERLSQLVVDVRKRVEGSTVEERKSQKWLPYLLPPPNQEMFVLNESGVLNPPQSSSVALGTPASEQPPSLSPTSPVPTTDPLRRLLDEASDLIDSPTASHITTLLLDSMFGHLTDLILRTQAFKLPPLPSASHPAHDPAFIDPAQRVVEITDSASLASDFASARAKLATILAVITRQAHAIGSGVPNEYVQSLESVRELEAFAAVVYSSNFGIEGIRIEEERRSEESEAGATAAAGQQSVGQPKSFLGRIFGGWW